MITASDFRDGSLVALLVGYDWESSAHFAELTVRGKDATERKFRISGLTSWGAFEDFAAQHISHCTFKPQVSTYAWIPSARVSARTETTFGLPAPAWQGALTSHSSRRLRRGLTRALGPA
jgi:hypothetical protein